MWADGHRLRDRPGSAEGAGHRTARHHGDRIIVDDVGSGPGILPSTDCV